MQRKMLSPTLVKKICKYSASYLLCHPIITKVPVKFYYVQYSLFADCGLLDCWFHFMFVLTFNVFVFRYRPLLPVKVVESHLGFNSRDECLKYLEDLKLVLSADKAKVDPKSQQNTEAVAAL